MPDLEIKFYRPFIHEQDSKAFQFIAGLLSLNNRYYKVEKVEKDFCTVKETEQASWKLTVAKLFLLLTLIFPLITLAILAFQATQLSGRKIIHCASASHPASTAHSPPIVTPAPTPSRTASSLIDDQIKDNRKPPVAIINSFFKKIEAECRNFEELGDWIAELIASREQILTDLGLRGVHARIFQNGFKLFIERFIIIPPHGDGEVLIASNFTKRSIENLPLYASSHKSLFKIKSGIEKVTPNFSQGFEIRVFPMIVKIKTADASDLYDTFSLLLSQKSQQMALCEALIMACIDDYAHLLAIEYADSEVVSLDNLAIFASTLFPLLQKEILGEKISHSLVEKMETHVMATLIQQFQGKYLAEFDRIRIKAWLDPLLARMNLPKIEFEERPKPRNTIDYTFMALPIDQ